MGFAEMTDEQLVIKAFEAERNLVTARFQHSTNQLENTASLRDLRRSIAKIRTELRSREVKNGLSKDALLQKYAPAAKGVGAAAPEQQAEKGSFLKGIVDKVSGNE